MLITLYEGMQGMMDNTFMNITNRSSKIALEHRPVRPTLASIGVVVALLTCGPAVDAQDLEPKAYSASPVGAAFLVVGLARSTGSVLTDPTLPLTDIEAKINGVPVAACLLYTSDAADERSSV